MLSHTIHYTQLALNIRLKYINHTLLIHNYTYIHIYKYICTYVYVTPTHCGSINTDKQIDLNAQFVRFWGKPKTSVKHPFHNDD